jgi:hypothetical protein
VGRELPLLWQLSSSLSGSVSRGKGERTPLTKLLLKQTTHSSTSVTTWTTLDKFEKLDLERGAFTVLSVANNLIIMDKRLMTN